MKKCNPFQDIIKLGLHRVIFVSFSFPFLFTFYNIFYLNIPNLRPYAKGHLGRIYINSLTLKFQ